MNNCAKASLRSGNVDLGLRVVGSSQEARGRDSNHYVQFNSDSCKWRTRQVNDYEARGEEEGDEDEGLDW